MRCGLAFLVSVKIGHQARPDPVHRLALWGCRVTSRCRSGNKLTRDTYISTSFFDPWRPRRTQCEDTGSVCIQSKLCCRIPRIYEVCQCCCATPSVGFPPFLPFRHVFRLFDPKIISCEPWVLELDFSRMAEHPTHSLGRACGASRGVGAWEWYPDNASKSCRTRNDR